MRNISFVECLLHRMDVEPSLAGDLIEQHHGGRSTLWLWRQALLAIVIFNGTTIWRHKFLAVRAVVVAWAVGTACQWMAIPIIEALRWPYGVRVGNYLLVSGHETDVPPHLSSVSV